MTPSQDIRIEQGLPYRMVLHCYADKALTTRVDVTGCTFVAAVATADGVTVDATCTIDDAAQGEVIMSLSDADTAQLPVGHHTWQLAYKDASELQRILVEGSVSVRKPIIKFTA